jgi:hypothetical protein
MRLSSPAQACATLFTTGDRYGRERTSVAIQTIGLLGGGVIALMANLAVPGHLLDLFVKSELLMTGFFQETRSSSN